MKIQIPKRSLKHWEVWQHWTHTPILWRGIFSTVLLAPTWPTFTCSTCQPPVSIGVGDIWLSKVLVWVLEVLTHPSLTNNRLIYQIIGRSVRQENIEKGKHPFRMAWKGWAGVDWTPSQWDWWTWKIGWLINCWSLTSPSSPSSDLPNLDSMSAKHIFWLLGRIGTSWRVDEAGSSRNVDLQRREYSQYELSVTTATSWMAATHPPIADYQGWLLTLSPVRDGTHCAIFP